MCHKNLFLLSNEKNNSIETLSDNKNFVEILAKNIKLVIVIYHFQILFFFVLKNVSRPVTLAIYLFIILKYVKLIKDFNIKHA